MLYQQNALTNFNLFVALSQVSKWRGIERPGVLKSKLLRNKCRIKVSVAYKSSYYEIYAVEDNEPQTMNHEP